MPSDVAFELFLAMFTPEDFSPAELRLYMFKMRQQQHDMERKR